MTKEILRWIQGIGAGALLTLLQYVQSSPTASWWQIAIVAGLVRALGFLISKLPVPTA